MGGGRGLPGGPPLGLCPRHALLDHRDLSRGTKVCSQRGAENILLEKLYLQLHIK